MVPMLNLKKQFDEIRGEVVDSLVEVLESTQYILGPKVRELEGKIASYVGAADAVGVASGTDALHLSLAALGVKKGDEVITTPFTFFSTVEAILYLGARPVFVDIDPETFNIDADKIEERITEKTKAVIPVHMFGHPADMEKIMSIAHRRGLKVVEDCAQSFGASIRGQKTGGFGNTGCFSFYPSKNLGACGDAGMITVKDAKMAERLKMLRNHGSSGGYMHDMVGYNSRLDELQAAILLVKLKRLDAHNELRRKKAAMYSSLLSVKVLCPVERDGAYHVYHQYTIKSEARDKIQMRLKEAGISSTVYYPLPLHLQKPLKRKGCKKGDFKTAEKVSKEVLSLPIGPELDESSIERISEIVLGV